MRSSLRALKPVKLPMAGSAPALTETCQRRVRKTGKTIRNGQNDKEKQQKLGKNDETRPC